MYVFCLFVDVQFAPLEKISLRCEEYQGVFFFEKKYHHQKGTKCEMFICRWTDYGLRATDIETFAKSVILNVIKIKINV